MTLGASVFTSLTVFIFCAPKNTKMKLRQLTKEVDSLHSYMNLDFLINHDRVNLNIKAIHHEKQSLFQKCEDSSML